SLSRRASNNWVNHCLICGSGNAPENASTGCPPAMAMTVGIDWTPNSCEIRGLASTSTLASTQAPLLSPASFSNTGPSCLHGPHQSAHRSTTTSCRSDLSTTSAWKVASVTSMTFPPAAPFVAWPPAPPCDACRAAASARAFTADRSTAPESEAETAGELLPDPRGCVTVSILAWTVDDVSAGPRLVERPHRSHPSFRARCCSTRSTFAANCPSCPGRMSALSTRLTRAAPSPAASTARLTTSITSSHSPSLLVNIALVSFGSPDSRTTCTARATASLTLPSSPPDGLTLNATINVLRLLFHTGFGDITPSPSSACRGSLLTSSLMKGPLRSEER